MHKICGEIFRCFCRKAVQISEPLQNTCSEMKDYELHSFSNFLIFRNQNDKVEGHEKGGVAKDTQCMHFIF